MGKRRSEDKEEQIRNKIKKLESKLRRQASRRARISYSSENEANDDILVIDNQDDDASPSQYEPVTEGAPPLITPVVVRPAPPHPTASPRAATPPRVPSRPASPLPGSSSAPDLPVPQPEGVAASSEDLDLDEETLMMLGDAPRPETALGNSIHKDVASRWRDILLKGLPKEIKDKIFQDYLVPSNCDLLIAPTLNPEPKAALPEVLVKRDFSIMQKQKQLGSALAALAQATDLLVKGESNSQKILKPLSDACRLLCDSHFLETKTRRNFVISAINTNLKDALINTVRDDFLFGNNVSEKLKAAQTIQKSGDTLKNTQKPFNNFNKNNFAIRPRNQKNNLNFKILHRRPAPQSRPDAGRSRPTQRQSRYSGSHRPPARSPARSPPRRTYRR